MGNIPRLEGKIKNKVDSWFAGYGENFIICTKEFCQGNRSALRPLMELLRDLAGHVFANDGNSLNTELLEDLEYGIFELIGRYNSTPGSEELSKSIEATVVDYVTEIFVDTKRRWNLNNFKITQSIEELDPFNGLIEARTHGQTRIVEESSESIEEQARKALQTMMDFARRKFHGQKNRKIAVKMLENPDRFRDVTWMAELADTSVGSAKVTLTRIKQTLARNFDISRLDGELRLTEIRNFHK
jgi:hypothetical protein